MGARQDFELVAGRSVELEVTHHTHVRQQGRRVGLMRSINQHRDARQSAAQVESVCDHVADRWLVVDERDDPPIPFQFGHRAPLERDVRHFERLFQHDLRVSSHDGEAAVTQTRDDAARHARKVASRQVDDIHTEFEHCSNEFRRSENNLVVPLPRVREEATPPERPELLTALNGDGKSVFILEQIED